MNHLDRSSTDGSVGAIFDNRDVYKENLDSLWFFPDVVLGEVI